jgi:hypothetical protein
VRSYPAGVTVSNHALITLSDALRHRAVHRWEPRWRRLTVGEQALLVVARLRKGEIYADLAAGCPRSRAVRHHPRGDGPSER